jgi:hypothetical protein
MAERVCILLGNAQHIEYPVNDLAGRIKELSHCQVINYSQKTDLHKLRMLGNDAVHVASSTDHSVIGKETVRDLISSEKARLHTEAIAARVLIVELVKDLYPLLIKGTVIGEITLTELVDESWKTDLVDYALSTNYQDKLKAGHVYTKLRLDAAVDDMYERGKNFDTNTECLGKSAAVYYEAACRLSINSVTGKLSVQKRLKIDKALSCQPDDASRNKYLLANHSDPECLYYFWDAIDSCVSFNPDEYPTYNWMLEAAASRGFPKAMAAYGAQLIEKEDTLEAGRDLLLSAAEHNEDLALVGLFQVDEEIIFNEVFKEALNDFKSGVEVIGKGALDYLFRGAALRGPECLNIVGESCHRIGLDDAENILLDAIKAGSVTAYHYYFNDLKGIMTKAEKRREKIVSQSMKKMSDLMGLLERDRTPVTKAGAVGRNEPCMCGSGKKFKKCCLS